LQAVKNLRESRSDKPIFCDRVRARKIGLRP